MMPAKIRRMSRRRQKIAIRRRMRELLRAKLIAGLSPFTDQPLTAETLQRIKAAAAHELAQLMRPLVEVTSSRLEGGVLHVTFKHVRPVEFINVTQAVGGDGDEGGTPC